MNKAVIYARYSSDRQRDCSIDQQVKVCREYADRTGLQVVNVYADHAITGKTDKRPNFQRMISDSKKKEWQFVIVYALDRFSRRTYAHAVYEHALNENGVNIRSATENIDENTPSSILMKGIVTAMSEYYSAELRCKINRGLNDNANRHLAPGSVPYGYRRSQDGHYIIEPSEAAVVREIYARVAHGEHLTDIYTSLNKRGIKGKNGAIWGRSSFNKMLSNRTYIGTYDYRGVYAEDAVPAILDKSIFYEVQKVMETKKNPRGATRRRNKNGVYLLSGKLFCECGSPMVGISGHSKTDGRMYYYYGCQNRRDHAGCTAPNLRREQIEDRVANAIREIMLDDDMIRWMAEQVFAVQEQSQDKTDRDLITQQLDDARKAQTNLLKAIEMGIINDMTKARMMELDEQIQALTAELAEPDEQNERFTVDDFISFFEIYREQPDTSELNQPLIDAFLVRADISGESLKIKITSPLKSEEVAVSVKETMWRCEVLNGKKIGFDGSCFYFVA